jgi:hypothetical protein
MVAVSPRQSQQINDNSKGLILENPQTKTEARIMDQRPPHTNLGDLLCNWEHRNQALHGNALTPTQELELEALRQQVTEEFTKGAATVQSNL